MDFIVAQHTQCNTRISTLFLSIGYEGVVIRAVDTWELHDKQEIDFMDWFDSSKPIRAFEKIN